jgi:hypothetical protein
LNLLHRNAPELSADIEFIKKTAALEFYVPGRQAGVADPKLDALVDKQKAEFNALPQDVQFLHHVLAFVYNDTYAIGTAINKATPKPLLGLEAFVDRYTKVCLPAYRRMLVNQANAHVMRIAPISDPDAEGVPPGTYGVFDRYCDKEPSTGFTEIEIDGRRLSAAQLAELMKQHGTPVAAPDA